MSETTRAVDLQRRLLLAAGAGGAAAGLAGLSAPALGATKPLPAVAGFKDASRVIVHSSKTLETRRDAFSTSGVTDLKSLFMRNNLNAPDAAIVANPDAWTVELKGVAKPRTLSVGELKRMGLSSVAMVLQCSGNGRGFFKHKTSGSQWKVGAAGNTLWAGVRVKDVVEALGGVNEGLGFMTTSGGEVLPAGLDPKSVMVERSVPLAGLEEALLAWELNGEPLPLAHGGPLRIVIPGYYGVNNVKYVRKVEFTASETKAKIQTSGYRVRDIGAKGAPSQPSMWEMNVKSFVTHPADGSKRLRAGRNQIHGVAFSGGKSIRFVEVSIDGGRSWREAELVGPDMGKHAWRNFVLSVDLAPGSYEIASRATDDDSATQPESRVENHRGYGHNGWRDHAVKATVA